MTEPDERAWAASVLPRSLGLADRHRDFFLRHRRFLRPHAGDFFAGEIELDVIDAVFDQRAHCAPHLLGSGNDEAEIEALVRNVGGRGIAEAADGRDFGPCGAIARAWDHAAVDGVANDDVEARLGGRGAAARGEAGVEHELRHLRGDERVLFGRHHLDGIDARGVVPGEMKMRVAQAGHQRRAHAVDDRLPAAAAKPSVIREEPLVTCLMRLPCTDDFAACRDNRRCRRECGRW